MKQKGGHIRLTQEEKILKYLINYGSITAFEAVKDLGILQLSARLCGLKKQGYNFTTTWVSSKNRDGDNISFCKYELAEW